jgi:hypothetical protein
MVDTNYFWDTYNKNNMYPLGKGKHIPETALLIFENTLDIPLLFKEGSRFGSTAGLVIPAAF